MSEEQVTVQMDVSKILAAILTHHESISVPSDLFMEEYAGDKQIEITYNEETNSFIFKLGDKIEQS